ncbi:MAG TPA: phosphoribosylamine--glycine ligase [Candidatus Limnocylindrales bacterium]|nr:phosphoribosylamine--glycine ligase [Candidatus Limnocylindrales bacterium]
MKVLVIGGGGREHALVWKLRQCASVEQVWCAPGNDGIAQDAECMAADVGNIAALAELAGKLGPDLTIVGPEQPLVLGIADEFAKRGLPLLGPSCDAAQLEGSKVFAKEFMARHNIPTAAPYGIFDSAVDAYTSLCEVDWPVVVKADGLCGGKGVLVTSSPDEATAFIERLMEKKEFGGAGCRVIIEEGLSGPEISYIVLTDGERFVPLAASRDYKRIFDGDNGPNTGGMGAISSDDLLSTEMETVIQEKVVRPTITGMARSGHGYRGFLYFGLMMTQTGPKVLEFNCRLGDPETQALMMRADFDLASAAQAATTGDLGKLEMRWSPKASVCIVLAADGYPRKMKTGAKITGLQRTTDCAVFHAGTKMTDGCYYVSSGRVLSIASGGETIEEARVKAYAAASQISFEGMQYRKDIGRQAGEVAHG